MNKSELKDKIIYAFFPRRCKYCGTVIKPEETLCESCEKHLPRVEKPVCFKCGRSAGDCDCRKKSSYYDRVIAPFYYTGAIEKGVRRMKFDFVESLCESYADDMTECVRENYENARYDFVCFVPFSERDMTKRPFNQSELLAKRIAENLGLECLDALVRLYDSDVQHQLGAKLRKGKKVPIAVCLKPRQMENAFSV